MANSKHLEILKQGVEVWNTWRDANPKIRPDLSDADLSLMDLARAYLSDADLSNANLQGVNLHLAQLNRANLNGANLESADLSDADIVRGTLVGTNLRKANLTGAELQYSDLSNADFSSANLTKATVDDAVLNRARFVNADLTWAYCSEANFAGADLSGAILKGATLRNAKIYGVNLKQAKVAGAKFDGLDLNQLIISEEDRVLLQEERRTEMARREGSIMLGSVEGDGGFAEPRTQVYFTAYHPIELAPQVWSTLLVYAHVPSAAAAVATDSGLRLANRAPEYRKRLGVATESIKRGAELTFVPEMQGCRFNPPQAKVTWLEDWHCVEFRVQATPELVGFDGMAANGRIAIYVEPILVAEIKFGVVLSSNEDPVTNRDPIKREAKPYQAIFVSYSHDDTHIVEQLGKAYKVLGHQYLQDVRILRSGEAWNPALLKKIDDADLFQLCWSSAAKRSPHVEQEWQHAVALLRAEFIRPVYWEQPMPTPPPELNDIHFAYLEGHEG